MMGKLIRMIVNDDRGSGVMLVDVRVMIVADAIR